MQCSALDLPPCWHLPDAEAKVTDATTANPTETEATTEAVTVATTEATTEAQPEKDKDGFTICNDKVKTT